MQDWDSTQQRVISRRSLCPLNVSTSAHQVVASLVATKEGWHLHQLRTEWFPESGDLRVCGQPQPLLPLIRLLAPLTRSGVGHGPGTGVEGLPGASANSRRAAQPGSLAGRLP